MQRYEYSFSHVTFVALAEIARAAEGPAIEKLWVAEQPLASDTDTTCIEVSKKYESNVFSSILWI